MADLIEHIEEYRLKRDDIMNEVTDAAKESTKIPRLQQALQEFDENFDVIGLVNFNWGRAKAKSLSSDDRYIRERFIPQRKITVIKKVSGRTGQNVQDVRHGAVDYSATPEPKNTGAGHAPCAQGRLAAVDDIGGHESLIDYTTEYKVGATYFPADRVCRYQHEDIADRRAIRQSALDWASGFNDGQVIPVHECKSFVYKRRSPKDIGTPILLQVHPVHCLVPHS